MLLFVNNRRYCNQKPEVNIHRTRLFGCGDKLLVFDSWSYTIEVMRMWYILVYLYYLGQKNHDAQHWAFLQEQDSSMQVFAYLPRDRQVWIADY
jgi:hypothetical protein